MQGILSSEAIEEEKIEEESEEEEQIPQLKREHQIPIIEKIPD
jgi:hypothetical protein